MTCPALVVDTPGAIIWISIPFPEFKFRKTKDLRVLRFLTSSSSIFMESSTTCLSLIKHMKDLKNNVVITSSLHASRLLANNTDASIILLGGQVYEGSILTGHLAVESVKQFHTDMMFFSCSGISASAGITSIEPKVVEVSREMMRHTSKKILLADTSKVGIETLHLLADLSLPDYVIMEKAPDDEELVNILGDRLITKCHLLQGSAKCRRYTGEVQKIGYKFLFHSR